MMYRVCHIGAQGVNMARSILSLLLSLARSPFQIIQHFINITLLSVISCSLLKLFLANSLVILTKVSSSTVLYAAVPYSS